MSLLLIDLSQDVDFVPIDVSQVPYSFFIKLEDDTYKFTIRYNEVGKFFTADLFDVNGNVLAFGDVIRYGRQMFNVIEDERFPIPLIIPTALAGEISEITWDNLGKDVKLYLHERKAK